MVDQKRNPKNSDTTLFKKLTNLLSGPITTRRTQNYQKLRRTQLNNYSSKFKSASGQSFKKSSYNPFEQIQTQRLQNYNRAERYREFNQMEYTPEISSALDIYADEMTTSSELQPLLRVDCSNEEIKTIIHSLFYDVLNIEYNAYGWSRNMCRDGDFFLYLEIDPDIGITNAIGLPSDQIERMEGEDKTNPNYVQFQWNSGGMTFENWQVAHFRINGNDKYAPYGTSVLEGARRIYRQLLLLEDSMMAYRIVRSPERRVFYIDVGGIGPEDVEQYMQKIITNMKRHTVVDEETGRVDLRYNPMCHFPNDFIYLCDGRRVTFKDLADNWESYKENTYVWSLDENKSVVPTKLLWAGQTIEKGKAKFLEVTLDDGQIIRTTPNHKWLLRDGTEVLASELYDGDSLMPFYAKDNTRLTARHGSRDNFYVDIYHPSEQPSKWQTGHQLVGQWKYGEVYKWPFITHHENHVKFNNHPDNLTKMTQSEHAAMHLDRVIAYNKPDAGRKNSKRNMKSLWSEGKISSEMCVDMWKDETIRQKRVDVLSFKTDSRLINFTAMALMELSTQAKEYEVREWLNSSEDFQTYLKEMNADFKNGLQDQLTKNQFRYQLRANNFENLRAVKDFYAANVAPWEKIVAFCEAERPQTRKEVLRAFPGLSRYDLKRTIESHGMTLEQFDERFINKVAGVVALPCDLCGTYFERQRANAHKTNFCGQECYWESMRSAPKQQLEQEAILNHKVVSVREYEGEDVAAYAVTVENPSHIVAIGGSNAATLRNDVWKSGVFVKNSIEEDYYIPVRGQNNTKIETLPGGSYTGDIDDVKYLRDKLFSALKIPHSYLSRDAEAGEDKSTLAQKDIRFARTVQRLQRSLISELEKIAMVHLLTLGYEGEDILSYRLTLNNPSRIAELQELEAWRTKFEVAAQATEGFFSTRWTYQNIFGMADEEIHRIKREIYHDKKFTNGLEALAEQGDGGEAAGLGGALGGMDDSAFGDEGMGELGDMGADDAVPDTGLEGEMGGGETSPEFEDGDLLSAPGRRDDGYTTPGSKGKVYYPAKVDRRDRGARTRSMKSKYGDEKSSSTKRNVFPGMSNLSTFSKGIDEFKRRHYEEERDILSVNNKNKSILKEVLDLDKEEKNEAQ